MLRIHEDQMTRLGAQARDGFVMRMRDYLAANYAGRVPGDHAALEAWVQHVVDKADRHGIRHEGPVAQYMLLLLVLGEDADERLPWVAETLGDTGLAGLGKVRRIVQLARAQAVPGIEDVTVVTEVCQP